MGENRCKEFEGGGPVFPTNRMKSCAKKVGNPLQNLQNSNYTFLRKFVTKTNRLFKISHSNLQNISLNKMVLTILKRLLVSEATIQCNRHPQCFKGLQQFLLMVILPFLSI